MCFYTLNKICKTDHRVWNQNDHNFIKYLQTVFPLTFLVRSDVANVDQLGKYKPIHHQFLHYYVLAVHYWQGYAYSPQEVNDFSNQYLPASRQVQLFIKRTNSVFKLVQFFKFQVNGGVHQDWEPKQDYSEYYCRNWA